MPGCKAASSVWARKTKAKRPRRPWKRKATRRQRAILPARGWLALAGVVVLGLLAVAYFTSRGRTGNAAQPKIKSLAVLPLKNLSGDPTQEYLADGMTEALIGRLSAIHDLRVISRTSVMRFKNPQLSAPDIARVLGVDAIVEGSVMREGNRIRVTAQLIRGATDEHFWSETYDRELRDALDLQSELAQTVAEKVEVTVTGEEHERLAAARQVAPDVYDSYLEGSNSLSTRATAKTNSRRASHTSRMPLEEILRLHPPMSVSQMHIAILARFS